MAPGGFQAVGAKEFVDWTPSVVLPGAQSCRGSGYPRDPVVECVVYRTDSEVQAADKFEQEATKLAEASKSGKLEDLKAAATAVGNACKGCHDEFRNK